MFKKTHMTLAEVVRSIMPDVPCRCGSPHDAAKTGLRVASQDHDSACHIWYARVHAAAMLMHCRAMVKPNSPTMTEEEATAFVKGMGPLLSGLATASMADMSGALQALLDDEDAAKLYYEFVDNAGAQPKIILE